jgi:2-amino-4-hydroxy-6-hydroxymethyldihydropteridine diphosphokinase
MARAYLGLGGNIGDVRATLREALARLDTSGARVIARSADYETPPGGKLDQPAFVNLCAIVETELDPEALLALCLKVEADLGRRRLEKWGPRAIDIDVLAYEDTAAPGADAPPEGARPAPTQPVLTLASPTLTIPHPYMLERAFVLLPLAEIAPDLVIRGTRVADAAAAMGHEGIVRLD